ELTTRLNDVGKPAIPHSILNKPASSACEWAVMGRHPEWGGDMLAEVPASTPSPRRSTVTTSGGTAAATRAASAATTSRLRAASSRVCDVFSA
ncbi:MAG TPA: hypothetical protein VE528_04340, partial [Thermoleophilaceae bacterium]|nr:hypothetical protein [Thermoleophilaceae bacterium]